MATSFIKAEVRLDLLCFLLLDLNASLIAKVALIFFIFAVCLKTRAAALKVLASTSTCLLYALFLLDRALLFEVSPLKVLLFGLLLFDGHVLTRG